MNPWNGSSLYRLLSSKQALSVSDVDTIPWRPVGARRGLAFLSLSQPSVLSVGQPSCVVGCTGGWQSPALSLRLWLRAALFAALGWTMWSLGWSCAQNTCCWLLNSEKENIIAFPTQLARTHPIKSLAHGVASAQILDSLYSSSELVSHLAKCFLLPPQSRPCAPATPGSWDWWYPTPRLLGSSICSLWAVLCCTGVGGGLLPGF